MRCPLLLGFLTLTAFSTLAAGEPPYHLFNPVPFAELRELSPDRPDATESPITVDAGHLQLEMSFLDYSQEGDLGTLAAGAMNVKLGLFENTDVQFLFDLHTWEDTPDGTVDGFSDVQVRLKQNLWGNDGGKTAFGLMPFVKIPTHTALSNGEVEGGLIVPFSVDLTERIDLSLMAEIDWVYDEVTVDYTTDLVHTAVLGYDVTESWGLYTEYVGVAPGEGAYECYFSSGLTWKLGENRMLDLGGLAGLNSAATDFQVFSGMTIRF